MSITCAFVCMSAMVLLSPRYLDVVVECMHISHLAVAVLVSTNEEQQFAYLPSHHRSLLGHHVLTKVVGPSRLKLTTFTQFLHLLVPTEEIMLQNIMPESLKNYCKKKFRKE